MAFEPAYHRARAQTSASCAAPAIIDGDREPAPRGAVDFVAGGRPPYRLAVWPQPRRYNFGPIGHLR